MTAAVPAGAGADAVATISPGAYREGAPVSRTMKCPGFLGIEYNANVVTTRVGQQNGEWNGLWTAAFTAERGYPYRVQVAVDMGDFCRDDAAVHTELFLPPDTRFSGSGSVECFYSPPGDTRWQLVSDDPAYNCPQGTPGTGWEGYDLGERRLPKNSRFVVTARVVSSTTLQNAELKGLVDTDRTGAHAYPTVGVNVSEFAPATRGFRIDGSPKVGATLTCAGEWSRFPDVTEYGWDRLTPSGWVGVGSGRSYTVGDTENGAQFRCGSRAHNAVGWSEWAISSPVTVDGYVPPVNQSRPLITGTATEGQTLTCQPGSWRYATGYQYEWMRGGTVVGSGQTRTLVAGDAGKEIHCRVTAAGPGGTAPAFSDVLTPRAKPEPPKPEPPKPEPPKPEPVKPQPVNPEPVRPQPEVPAPQPPQVVPAPQPPRQPGAKPAKAGKCSKLKGKKRAACVKKACGRKKGAKKKACVKSVTRRGRSR
jgi:hypothetical protein